MKKLTKEEIQKKSDAFYAREQSRRDFKIMKERKEAHVKKLKDEEAACTEVTHTKANEEYLFGPPGRDTLWDLCEQIYELGRELVDSANNAERVENLRALERISNELSFDCTDYLMDLGATVVDEDGECYDAIVLPIKTGDNK